MKLVVTEKKVKLLADLHGESRYKKDKPHVLRRYKIKKYNFQLKKYIIWVDIAKF